MDEHEVELIDYLRVLWWGKWIVLACFAIALGLSAMYAFLQPITYRGTMELTVREYLTATMVEDRSATPAVEAAITAALETVQGAVGGTSAQYASGRISLSRSGGASGDLVRGALLQAEEELQRELPLALQVELDHLAVQLQLQIDAMLAQRDLLLQRADDTAVTEALSEQIANLETDIAIAQVRLRAVETANPEALIVLNVSKPATARVVATSRRTTMAVAGFLGLLLGVLFAFFVHYLRQVRWREQGMSGGATVDRAGSPRS